MNKAIAYTQWFLHGRKHFRQKGYYQHKKKYDSPVQNRANIGRNVEGSDGVNLDGKVIIVTG